MTVDGAKFEDPTRLRATPGRRLSSDLQRRAETATGQSLDDVQVHEGAQAQAWVDGMGALGAGIGRDVALGSAARDGLLREAVLAHELAHAALGPDQHGEAAANRVAVGILTGRRVSAGVSAGVSARVSTGAPDRGRSGGLALHRCKKDPPPKVRDAAAKTDPAKLSGFERMVQGGVPAADAAEKVQLPKELTDALAEAWRNSFPGGTSKEQGGILVRKADGTLDWVPATSSTSGSTDLPWGALPSGATPLVAAHTHPYDAGEGGHKGVTFSGGDLGNLVTDATALKVVHAGDRYFAVAKTKAFEDLVATKPDKGAFRDAISAEWNTAYQAASGDIPARARKATAAICATYHLVLYEGQLDGSLAKVTTP
jgi:hypothetical protein